MKKKKLKKVLKNLVAKYMNDMHKPATYQDRKKEDKKDPPKYFMDEY